MKKKFGYDPDTGTWNGYRLTRDDFTDEASARKFIDDYQNHLQATGRISPLIFFDPHSGLWCDHPITGFERPDELYPLDFEAEAVSSRENTAKISPIVYYDASTELYCNHPITGNETPDEFFPLDFGDSANCAVIIPEHDGPAARSTSIASEPIEICEEPVPLQEEPHEVLTADALVCEPHTPGETSTQIEMVKPPLQNLMSTIASAVPAFLQAVMENPKPSQSKPIRSTRNEKEPVPTHMDLADKLIADGNICRVKSKLYFYYDGYYHALDSNSEDTLIYVRLHDDLRISGHANQFDGIKRFVTANPSVCAENLVPPVNLLNVQNGILDLSYLNAASLPAIHSNRVFFTSRLEAPWNPKAVCPRFDAFLETVTGGDPVMIERFWQVLGYNLVPDQNRGKVFTFLYGVSHSGKSVFADLLSSFFPEDVVSSVSTHDMEGPFGYEGLVGKVINICAELPSAPLMSKATGKIKAITGGDTVNVNEKNVKTYKAKLDVKLVFASNHPISLTSADDAFLQRCIELPFPYAIPAAQRDRFLKEKLYAERAGILYKAILAYLRLRANNYIFPLEGIYKPHVFGGRSAEKNTPQDDVLDFIETACSLDPNAQVHTTMLFDYYTKLAPARKWTSFADEHAFGCCLQTVINKYLPTLKKDKFRINGNLRNGYRGLSMELPT